MRLSSPWDDRGRVKEPQAGHQMLPSPLALVLPEGHLLGLREGPDHLRAGHSLSLLQEGREGRQGRLPPGDGTVRSELHLVEGTLSEPPEPAVESREVGLCHGGLVPTHARAKAMDASEVDLGEVGDDRK